MWTVAYGISAGVSFAGCAAALLYLFLLWARARPPGAQPTLAGLMSEQPGILWVSGFGLLLGIGLAGGGLWMWRSVLGSESAPPKKVVLTVVGMPLLLDVVCSLLLVGNLGPLVVAFLPIMFGFTLALVPLAIGGLAFGLLKIASDQINQWPNICPDDELPANVASYFDRHNSPAAEAGLVPVGTYCYEPKRVKYRRVWMAPNGAYFVDATHASVAATSICGVGVYSATEDGHYFETSDVDQPTFESAEGVAHVTKLPGASLPELIEKHIQVVSDWVVRTGRHPLEFAASDECELADYGIAAHMQHVTHDLLWLGNPYRNQTLPPLPGRVWQGEKSPDTLIGAPG